ncbi:MAG: helix-turn-helix transcriptional regulator [Clostridia bacterium]|nr:helix-turn-helix transcriptional regulator [Clostridia bacterium]
MYKNKAKNGINNICGLKIKQYREGLPQRTSQRRFAELMQAEGIDLDKNAIQRIESGKRFVTDIELKAFARVLGVSYSDLLDE